MLNSRPTARESLEDTPFIIGYPENPGEIRSRYESREDAEKYANESAKRGGTLGVYKLVSIIEPATSITKVDDDVVDDDLPF